LKGRIRCQGEFGVRSCLTKNRSDTVPCPAGRRAVAAVSGSVGFCQLPLASRRRAVGIGRFWSVLIGPLADWAVYAPPRSYHEAHEGHEKGAGPELQVFPSCDSCPSCRSWSTLSLTPAQTIRASTHSVPLRGPCTPRATPWPEPSKFSEKKRRPRFKFAILRMGALRTPCTRRAIHPLRATVPRPARSRARVDTIAAGTEADDQTAAIQPARAKRWMSPFLP
jgi:hypothetical protein